MKTKETRSRNEQILNDPIEKVIPRLAGPTILSMLITSIYNMADTFFVSQIGTSASGAVGIIYSAMALIQAFAFMIGQGAGNQISQLLGKGQEEEAKNYASVAWFTGFGVGIVVAVLGMTKMESIVMLLGSTETIAPYAVDYARYIFLAAPFMICSFIMNNLLRFQGLAVYSMVGITIGGVLNIVLDPILIFGIGLGTMGAGIATGFSQLVSFCILLLMCNLHKDTIRITPRNYRPTIHMYGSILYTGAPTLQVAVRPGAGQRQHQHIAINAIDKQPVRQDVAFPVTHPVAGQVVAFVLFRKRFAQGKAGYNILQQLDFQPSLDGPAYSLF